MGREEKLMVQRESILKNKYKYDGCFIFCEGSFYGEGLNEENAKNMCDALNQLVDKYENERPITIGDVKTFLGLLFDLSEMNKPNIKKIIGSDKPDIKRIKKSIKNNLKRIKGD